MKDTGVREVKVRVIGARICGSDLHAYNHGLALAYEKHPVTHDKVPLVLGHELSDTVEKVGESCNFSTWRGLNIEI